MHRENIRAGLCHDTYSAHQGVEHDHMNVLVLGARVIADHVAYELVRAFVGAKESRKSGISGGSQRLTPLKREAARRS